MPEDARDIERAKRLLAKHGFKVAIWGCGCCESPRVKMSYLDEIIVGQGDGRAGFNINFDMFTESDDGDDD